MFRNFLNKVFSDKALNNCRCQTVFINYTQVPKNWAILMDPQDNNLTKKVYQQLRSLKMVTKDTISSADKAPKYQISDQLMSNVLSCLLKAIETQSSRNDMKYENTELKRQNGEQKELNSKLMTSLDTLSQKHEQLKKLMQEQRLINQEKPEQQPNQSQFQERAHNQARYDPESSNMGRRIDDLRDEFYQLKETTNKNLVKRNELLEKKVNTHQKKEMDLQKNIQTLRGSNMVLQRKLLTMEVKLSELDRENRALKLKLQSTKDLNKGLKKQVKLNQAEQLLDKASIKDLERQFIKMEEPSRDHFNWDDFADPASDSPKSSDSDEACVVCLSKIFDEDKCQVCGHDRLKVQ